MTELRYPDFICIGAQKAGTTWLDRNLRRHPRLWLPPIKEVHYFNDLYVPSSRVWTARHRRKASGTFTRHVQNNEPEEWDYHFLGVVAGIVAGPISDEWYGRIFSLAPQDQICGEITPDYCTLPPAGIEHVLKLSPHVKIIFSLRDPIERSWSHIRMLMRNRGTRDKEEMERFARHVEVYDRTNYPAIISAWRKYVPEDRFLIVFMDDIDRKPGAVLKNICRFLEVDFRPKYFKKSSIPVHVGEEQAMPPNILGILKERLRPIYDNIEELYPEVAAAWIRQHYSAESDIPESAA